MLNTPTRVSFAKNIGFSKALNKRVDAYFQAENLSQRDNLAMYAKTIIILAWVISAWIFTLFGPPIMWMKVVSCFVLGLAIAAAAFNIGHDANHGGYSSNRKINNILGLSYDLFVGISSYLWKFRHNFLHHTYTNIVGHDYDLNWDGLVRLCEPIEHQKHHKFQHLYIWFLHAMMPLYWSATDVHMILKKRQCHEYVLPKTKPFDLFVLFGFKLIWITLFLVLPVAIGYTPLQTILGVFIAYMTAGLVAGVVFILAHVGEIQEFPEPNSESKNVDDEWAVSQVRTTVDFAPNNPILNWYLGGLNYQTVHHLFPNICHIHYPKIAPILAEVCEEFGVKYNVYPTFGDALAANYRWLKIMGAKPE
jgi:linoleoyl-CoA desaturase